MNTIFSQWLDLMMERAGVRWKVPSVSSDALRNTLSFLTTGEATVPEPLRGSIEFDREQGAVRIEGRLLRAEPQPERPFWLPGGHLQVTVRFTVLNDPSSFGPTVTLTSLTGFEQNLREVLAVARRPISLFAPVATEGVEKLIGVPRPLVREPAVEDPASWDVQGIMAALREEYGEEFALEEEASRERERQEGEFGRRAVTPQEQVDVPLQREEVVIERDPQAARGEGHLGVDSETVRAELEAMSANVQKQAYVTEEVEVGKRTVTEQPVTDTVGREVLDVNQKGDVQRGGRDDVGAPAASDDEGGRGGSR